MKKIYIWGAGDIGRRIMSHLNEDWDIAFVDSNEQLVGSLYCGKNVISVKDYFEKYSEEFILIAHLYETENIDLLQQYNITNYFVHSDLPAEFKEPYPRENLKKYIINYLGNRNNFVLYGLSLYSIVIDDWIYGKFGRHPYILIQKNISGEFVKKVGQKYTDLKLIYDISALMSIEEICICTDNFDKFLKDEQIGQYHLTDIFDCSDKIENYSNPEIEKFHNIHNGKRCFIVATGPSLKMQDLNLLKCRGELCISMNSIYHAFHETDWRPDYYAVFDYREIDNIKEMIDGWGVKASFVSDNTKPFWEIPHKKNVYRYYLSYEYCYDRLPKFSENISRRVYNGANITYICIQLAVYMGFKEIYLLGVDFSNGSQGKNVSFPHFYKDSSECHSTAYIRHAFLAYQAARQYADSHEIKIYNATRGGELEVFPRVNFDALFQ
ncbi:MAG: DUF115 domain-containing protein [Lachnospiraceae bacterium]|nr:DUF115 domain-containing protein [Lachnospiraceae bacterium]